MKLHGFGDASRKGCCAAIYGVVKQGEYTSQGLLASKSRIDNPETGISGAHMVANLLQNVRTALEGYNITGMFAWSDSTVVLCWIMSTNREWKQFVTNRIVKIRQKENLQWKYCPTAENPADFGSRGCKADNLGDLWWKGPDWSANEADWPEGSCEPKQTKEVTDEEKVVKQSSFVAIDGEVNRIQDLLNKFKLWKVILVVAWTRRFINKCRSKLKRSNSLVTHETQEAGNITGHGGVSSLYTDEQ